MNLFEKNLFIKITKKNIETFYKDIFDKNINVNMIQNIILI